MRQYLTALARLLTLNMSRFRSLDANEEIRDALKTEGRLRLSQYLLGFSAISERVPIEMWVTKDSFVFVNARYGWDHWDFDAENPNVVCVVPRTGVSRVALLRDVYATDMVNSVGVEDGLQELLTCPEHGLVLLAIIMKDSEGEHQEPLFLLDTGVMESGEDELVLAFVHNMSFEPRPDTFLLENETGERH